MKVELENYQIITDDVQFIVQKKRIIQAGKMTLPENIGKEVWEDMAYCRTLNYALKVIGTQIVLDNDDFKDILQKLNKLEKKIDGMIELLEISEVVEDDTSEED